MEKRKTTEGKIYKPQGVRMWGSVILIGILAIQVVVVLFMFSRNGMPDARVWITNGIVFMLAVALYWLFVQVSESSLTVYENGLEWRRGNSTMFTTWDNMQAIVRKDEGDATTYGIQLVKSVDVEINGWIDRFFYGTSADYIRLTGVVPVPTHWEGLSQGNVIKLDEFADTEFGQDLLHYAPNLFDRLP